MAAPSTVDNQTLVTAPVLAHRSDAFLSLHRRASLPRSSSHPPLLRRRYAQGIQINRFDGGDMFQPLMFQTTTQAGKTTDLYAKAFGDLPELARAMGSSAAANSLLRASL